MAFPPEFSSTETYANRYDLDEIDIWLEGDSNNPMYFNISGLPSKLSYGKHYFNFSTLDDSQQEYRLKPHSRVLFEFKSINNVVLRSDIVTINQLNGVATGYVDVLEDPLRTFEEIKDGDGKLIVVGTLEPNFTAEQGIFNNKSRPQINMIPIKFRDAINYRCVFPIEIRKNLMNADSPIITNSEHESKTINGQYSFAKAAISPLKTSNKGMTYNDNTGLPDRPIRDESKGGSLS